MDRKKPNILITGTPGTGKTTLIKALEASETFKMNQINSLIISEFVKQNQLYQEFDPEYDTHVLDEEALIHRLRPLVKGSGGFILDYHSGDLFPQSWFDAVFVLRADNTVLYDRLDGRGYSGKKMEDNITCEIMQTILDEAVDHFGEERVTQLQSDSKEDLKKNCQKIQEFITQWIESHGS